MVNLMECRVEERCPESITRQMKSLVGYQNDGSVGPQEETFPGSSNWQHFLLVVRM